MSKIDTSQEAIAALIAKALPDSQWLPANLRATREMLTALAAERDALRAENERLRAFIADFAGADFPALTPPPFSHPADEPDPVTDASAVWAWQEDANGVLKGGAA